MRCPSAFFAHSTITPKGRKFVEITKGTFTAIHRVRRVLHYFFTLYRVVSRNDLRLERMRGPVVVALDGEQLSTLPSMADDGPYNGKTYVCVRETE